MKVNVSQDSTDGFKSYAFNFNDIFLPGEEIFLVLKMTSDTEDAEITMKNIGVFTKYLGDKQTYY